ncbi:MAG TPA: LCP family protein [Candidatus Limnocylindrales bacterium]
MNPAGTLVPAPERRSPSIAAFLSFLWPGLGHWYTRRQRPALLFALPVIGAVLVVAVQAIGGAGRLASLLISPSSALTVAILIVLLGVWREIALIDSAMAIRPRGAWRRGRSLVVVILLTFIIVASHAWAGYVAWAFYDAGTRIFVGSEGPDAVAGVPTATPGPGQTADPNDEYVVPPFATPATESARINVLLTGVDSAETRSHALTDTLLIASIDPVTRDVAMISFPRDISDFPMIDGRTYTGKINSFMTYVNNHPSEFKDKPLVELAKELSFLVGAPIHYYAAVDLAGFRRLIDAAGGVTITNDRAINDPVYDWIDHSHAQGFQLSVGTHKLDGETALAYVRSRYTPGDSDFDRARRQQEVLLALAKSLTNPAMLPKIPQLMSVAGDTLRTNFPSDRISEMLDLATGIDSNAVTQVVLGPPYSVHPPTGQTGGIYTLRLNMDKVAALSIKVFGSQSTYPQPSP